MYNARTSLAERPRFRFSDSILNGAATDEIAYMLVSGESAISDCEEASIMQYDIVMVYTAEHPSAQLA